MGAEETRYSVAWAGPELLERGRSNVVRCPVFRSNAAVVPTAYALTVYGPDGAVLATPSVTVVSSAAQATLTAGTMAAWAYGEGYRLEWTLTLDGVADHVFRRDCIVGKYNWTLTVTVEDLWKGRHSDLPDLVVGGAAGLQDYLDQVVREFVHDLRQQGSLAHLVASGEDFRYVIIYRTLAAVFQDFKLVPDGEAKWGPDAARYEKKAADAWGKLSFKYDADEDGQAETTRRPAAGVTFLASSGDGWEYV